MTRILKPLDPTFLRLCQAVLDTPERFPLTIGYATAKDAQHNRCLFYTFRRLLSTYASDTTGQHIDLIPIYNASETLYCPRIDYEGSAPYNLTFALRATRPVLATMTAALDDLLGQAIAPPANPAVDSAPSAPDLDAPYLRTIPMAGGTLHLPISGPDDTNGIKPDSSIIALYKMNKLPSASFVSDEVPE